MLLIILLAIAIFAQFFAAIIAIRLTRTTKYNASWILITIALVLMCVMMAAQFLRVLGRFYDNIYTLELHENVSITIGVITSLCFAVGVFLIQKILAYISLREELRRKSDERVLSATIQAEEAQRQRFAKELHDGLGPLLSTARLSISALAGRTTDELSKEILNNAEQAISLSVRTVRDVSNNLSPHILNNFGVTRALTNFINRLRLATETKIMFETNLKNERFTTDGEVVIYRSVCELINNSLKHSDARLMVVIMMYRAGEMVIEVKDDGKGFDTEVPTEGMGLSNIRSRISSIKGNIEIVSGEGSGTQIRIVLPIVVKS